MNSCLSNFIIELHYRTFYLILIFLFLVTMKWWNDLWLNEGFAEFMSYKSVNEIFPDWNIVNKNPICNFQSQFFFVFNSKIFIFQMNRFLTSNLHVAFKTDAKISSHPIVQTVSNPDEITAIFDVITYNKGASIIRMLEHFVNPDIFAAGISTYLSTYAYKNAETDDLLSILQKAVKNKINITSIMDTWTRQMGFPVVNVKRHDNTFTLTQKRFLLNPEAKYNDSESEFK